MTQYKMVDGVQMPLSDADIAQQKADLAAASIPPTLYLINKKTIWQRCTPDEAKALSAALDAAPARQQEIFRAALIIDTRDELYPVLYGSLVSLLDKARADAILAPTE